MPIDLYAVRYLSCLSSGPLLFFRLPKANENIFPTDFYLNWLLSKRDNSWILNTALKTHIIWQNEQRWTENKKTKTITLNLIQSQFHIFESCSIRFNRQIYWNQTETNILLIFGWKKRKIMEQKRDNMARWILTTQIISLTVQQYKTVTIGIFQTKNKQANHLNHWIDCRKNKELLFTFIIYAWNVDRETFNILTIIFDYHLRPSTIYWYMYILSQPIRWQINIKHKTQLNLFPFEAAIRQHSK